MVVHLKYHVPEAVIICGSRDWSDREMIRKRISGLRMGTVVITGKAPGADTIADEEAQKFRLNRVQCPANWAAYGKSSGPKRNTLMLALLMCFKAIAPVKVIAFRLRESSGTTNMLEQAKKQGITTECYDFK